MGKEVPAHPVIFLEVTDHGFDSRPAMQLTFDGVCDAAFLTGDINFKRMCCRGVMAAIAPVDDDAIDCRPGCCSFSGMSAARV